ncbi:MAG: uracil-DNA glycosylase [Armatimonadetes bacterium]|nr:uracil-DNA glycosylase [Armatimonadota bacterium]
MDLSISALNDRIVSCDRCPRLRTWCAQVARDKRRSYSDDAYWGKPVPNFGDTSAERLIVGLAPAAHGANRTGRMFTGDRSGEWLYRALHRAGAANQPNSLHIDDGLTLKNVLITAVNHCAPPDNKPFPLEVVSCHEYLELLIRGRVWKSVLCLGSIAWTEVMKTYGLRPLPEFGHGTYVDLSNGTRVIGSYHPSQQNTFTGRLTEEMLDEVVSSFISYR